MHLPCNHADKSTWGGLHPHTDCHALGLLHLILVVILQISLMGPMMQ